MKQLFIILFLIGLTGSFELSAQKDPVKEDFYDAEYFLSEEDYSEALYSFQKVFKAGFQENANINYRIGVCFLNIPGEKEKSIPYLEKAVKSISPSYKEGVFSETFAPTDALLYLGNAYRINYQLDKAIELYNSYIKASPKMSPVEADYTQQQIESCKRAKEAVKNPAPFFKENLGTSYNSTLNNFQVVFSGDGNSMAYMTQQKFYDAVYFVKKVNGDWTNPVNITPQIESDGNQYVSSLSYDGTRMYLVRIDNFDADILVSEFSMGRWNPSQSIGKIINTKYFESHASISSDGKTLYFTSNRTGGIGGMDIWSSVLNDAGEWMEPVNLGPGINTPLNEESPFISTDGKTLYFSSQGHSTIGGYDVFTSNLTAQNSWTEPFAFPYPLNTTDDDLFFFPGEKKSSGYMTLYSADGYGNGDLYYLKIITPEDEKAELEARLENERIRAEAQEAKEAELKKAEEAKAQAEPAVVFNKFTIKPVFFAFDSYLLTDASIEKLNDLVNALNNYPMLKIEVRGYTDAMGPYEYNQLLSERRAKAVADYIVGKGISSDRLKVGGYSETENVALNAYKDGRDALEGRKFNRRVEFRVSDIGGALLEIEPIEVPEQLKPE